MDNESFQKDTAASHRLVGVPQRPPRLKGGGRAGCGQHQQGRAAPTGARDLQVAQAWGVVADGQRSAGDTHACQ